jgi:tetratricopeptide (TPR) repeat protein
MKARLQQYLAQYRQSKSETNQHDQDQAGGKSVFITCQISVKHIWNTRRSAAELLSLSSFFDPSGIQSSLLQYRRCKETAREAVDRTREDVMTLQAYSLIAKTTNTTTFTMHGQVRVAIQRWLENAGQLEKWRAQFISNVCAELPTGQHENWNRCSTIFPHAQAALAQRPEDRESLMKWARLLYKAAWYAWQIGRAEDAEKMSVESMEARVEVFGEGHVETLSSMGMVGLAMALAGKFEEAANMHRHTLAQTETVLGLGHPDILPSMNNLALVLNSQGRYRAAEALNRKTLEATSKLLRRKHPDTLLSMHNLATVLANQGQYKEAEAMHRVTLKQFTDVLGPDHPHTMMSMNNLASVLDRQDKFNEAEALYRWTLAQREKLLGHEHPSTLASMSDLIAFLDSQDKCKEVEELEVKDLLRRTPNPLPRVNCLTCLFTSGHHYNQSKTQYAKRSAHHNSIAGKIDPKTCVHHQHHADVLAAVAECGQSVHTGRILRFLCRLAKTMTKGLKSSGG